MRPELLALELCHMRREQQRRRNDVDGPVFDWYVPYLFETGIGSCLVLAQTWTVFVFYCALVADLGEMGSLGQRTRTPESLGQ